MTGPSFFAPVYPPQHLASHVGTRSFSTHQSIRPPADPVRVSSRPFFVPNPPDQNLLDAESHPTMSVTSATRSASPPAYVTSSPPKYAPLPAECETALLLAPPPTFAESIRCNRCDLEGSYHSTTCPHLSPSAGSDWVVRLLILLNLLVWVAVLWGYWAQWTDTDCEGLNCGGFGHVGGSFGGVYYGRLETGNECMGVEKGCVSESCDKALVDC